MATPEVEVAKLSATFLQTASQAQSLSETLEKGQDATLSQLFHSIQDSYGTSSLPALLLPLSPEALEPACSWLFGPEQYNAIAATVQKFGVIELRFGKGSTVSLQAHGLTLEVATPGEIAARLQAVQISDDVPRRDLPILTLPVSDMLVDVAMYIPRDLAVLRDQSSILLRLLSRCSLAVFTASNLYTMSETDSAFLAEVLPGFEAVAPLVIEQEGEIPALPWWRAGALPGNPVLLPEVVLPREQPPVVNEDGTTEEPSPPPLAPEVLSNPVNPCRQALQIIIHSRKLSSAMEAATPRCDAELKKLSTTLSPLAQKLKDLEIQAKSKDTKAEIDAIKNLLEDELSDIQTYVEDRAALSIGRRGKFVIGVRDLVESVTEDDFEDVPGVKTIRKSLTQEFVERMLSVMGKDLREQLKMDCTEVSKRVREVNVELDEILTRIRGSQAHLELPMPDEKLIWHFIKNELSITSRCEVERPKKGVLTILAAGRKMLMPFFMTLGMIGFTSVRKSMASSHWQMFFVILGACIYAYYEARAEQQEKFEKELEKIKDTLSNEAGKIINDVQKEKVSRITTYLNMLKKQTLKRVDEQVKMFTEARTQLMDRDRANLQKKTRELETRIKELQDYTKGMEKLQVGARDSESNARKLLAEAAKGAPPVTRAATVATSRVATATPAAPRASSRVADAVAAATTTQVPAAATVEAPATAEPAAERSSRIPDIPRPERAERPPREPRPERPPREPKEKKEEAPKESAGSRMAALRASLKK